MKVKYPYIYNRIAIFFLTQSFGKNMTHQEISYTVLKSKIGVTLEYMGHDSSMHSHEYTQQKSMHFCTKRHVQKGHSNYS